MGEIEHAGTAKAMAAINDTVKTSEQGAVAGEICEDPTTKTIASPLDKVANDRGILPIPRPAAE